METYSVLRRCPKTAVVQESMAGANDAE